MSARGRELAAIVEKEDSYVGPAPVSFAEYFSMCQAQAKRERRVLGEEVDEDELVGAAAAGRRIAGG